MLNSDLYSLCKLMILEVGEMRFSIGNAVGPFARFLDDI